MVLRHHVIFGRDGDDGSSDGLQECEDVGGEVVVGVLQHQVAGQRAHVTHAVVGDLQVAEAKVTTVRDSWNKFQEP